MNEKHDFVSKLNIQSEKMYKCELLVDIAKEKAKKFKCNEAQKKYNEAVIKYDNMRNDLNESGKYLENNFVLVPEDTREEFMNSIILLKSKDDEYQKIYKQNCKISFMKRSTSTVLIILFFVIIILSPLMFPTIVIIYFLIFMFTTFRYIIRQTEKKDKMKL